MPHGAEKAAFRESPEPLHVNFQGGIIHHFLCAPTIRVPAICMADKNQQLVPVRLLKFDVFFIAHLGVLETVNDVKIGAFMLIHSFTKLGHRLTVKQLETAVYLGHVETAERVLHGEARTLFEAVISHPPKLCQLFTKLHDKAAFPVTTIAPNKPNANPFRLSESVRPCACQLERFFLHAYCFCYR